MESLEISRVVYNSTKFDEANMKSFNDVVHNQGSLFRDLYDASKAN